MCKIRMEAITQQIESPHIEIPSIYIEKVFKNGAWLNILCPIPESIHAHKYVFNPLSLSQIENSFISCLSHVDSKIQKCSAIAGLHNQDMVLHIK